MIVAQISDTHIALDTKDAKRRIDDFERIVADINAARPDVVIHTGDIVHNGRADEYARAAAILAQAQAPVHVMAGNKDHRDNLRAAFDMKGQGFVAYSIETFPVRLIALDTLDPAGNKGDFCEDRARHFIAMTDAEAAKPIAVFTHHPPYEVPVGPEPFHFVSREAMMRLRGALTRSGRVCGVFSGHVHRPSWGDIEGIRATVATTVATSLRWGDYPDHMKSCPIYSIHRFDPDGSFSTETRIAGDHSPL